MKTGRLPQRLKLHVRVVIDYVNKRISNLVTNIFAKTSVRNCFSQFLCIPGTVKSFEQKIVVFNFVTPSLLVSNLFYATALRWGGGGGGGCDHQAGPIKKVLMWLLDYGHTNILDSGALYSVVFAKPQRAGNFARQIVTAWELYQHDNALGMGGGRGWGRENVNFWIFEFLERNLSKVEVIHLSWEHRVAQQWTIFLLLFSPLWKSNSYIHI